MALNALPYSKMKMHPQALVTGHTGQRMAGPIGSPVTMSGQLIGCGDRRGLLNGKRLQGDDSSRVRNLHVTARRGN